MVIRMGPVPGATLIPPQSPTGLRGEVTAVSRPIDHVSPTRDTPGSLPLLLDRRPDSIRRQESGLIPLNLTILGGIALGHVLFAPVLGRPPRAFYLALLVRSLIQSVELILLQRRRGSVGGRAILAYAHVSIWVNLAFALLLSWLSGIQDSHYSVLMVIPVIAAAFRYRSPGIVLVVSSAAAATFLEVWIHRASGPSVLSNEYLEAASLALIHVVVGLVVAHMAQQLRDEQVAAERSLQELSRTKDRLVEEEKLAAVGRLASAIAHEVRNPVTMILSSLALARRGGEGAFPREELDAILSTEAARLERLTTDFLAYARGKAPDRAPCDVLSTLRYIADVTQARALETGVVVSVHAPESLRGFLDAFQIHQALLNLLVNALDAAPPGSEVVLGATPWLIAPASGGVVVTVQNAGAAVPEDLKQRIFEPFFTTKAAGSGLGLPIARRIAQAHGGDILLEVNEPGCVRFSLVIPGGPSAPSLEDGRAASAAR